MNFVENYPLQTYLQNILSASDSILLNMMDSGSLQDLVDMFLVNGRNLRSAQIFISIIPVMIIYPFLQKYFTTGLVMEASRVIICQGSSPERECRCQSPHQIIFGVGFGMRAVVAALIFQ
jgi:hypothetical protein